MYRASRDGFSATNFRSKCNEIEKTLTVITSESGNVFGGYTDKAWTSGNAEYITDPNAFIFSLINKKNKPFKVVCPDGGQDSIRCGPTHGPTFGRAPADIHIAENSNTNELSFCNFGNTYKHPDYPVGTIKAINIMAGSKLFKTTEIEVYTKVN